MSLSSLFQRMAQNVDARLPDENCTLLHLAARQGDLQMVQKLLAAGARTDMLDARAETPLINAIRGDNLAIVALLAKQTKDIDHSGNIGTALHVAADRGRVDMAIELLRAGANIDAGDADGTTPLMTALFARQSNMINFLLETGANTGALRKNGETALHIAARENDTASIDALIKKDGGAFLQTQTYTEKLTPLYIAVMTENIEAARRLVQHGVLPNIPDAKDRMPLDIAAARGNIPMARVLVVEAHADLNRYEYPEQRSALHHAIFENKTDMARQLVDWGADPLLTAEKKPPALLVAAWKGNLPLVKYFMEELPQPEAESAEMKKAYANALYEACAYGHEDVGLYLVQSGRLDFNVPAYNMGLPLSAAITFEREKIFNAMMDAGANPNGLTQEGQNTPLFAAVTKNNIPAARRLLEARANPDRGNEDQKPLHYCAEQGLTAMAQTLLTFGADPQSKDKHKRMAIDIARAKNRPELCKLLLAAEQDAGNDNARRPHSPKTGKQGFQP